MKETLEEFREKIMRFSGTTVHKITNSWGVYDAFKFYRKNKLKDKKYILTESQYFAIIRKMNSLYREALLQDKDIIFPACMGGLYSYVRQRGAYLNKEGKIIITRPIDWKETYKLWYNDEEAFANKTVIRKEIDKACGVTYSRYKAYYTNMSFYKFQVHQDIITQLNKNVREGTVIPIHIKKEFYG